MHDSTIHKKYMRAAFLSFILMILFAAPHLYSGQAIVLRVIDDSAQARLKPDPGSEVLRLFPLGAQLEATTKVGNWYEISYTNEDGYTITAYILSSSVEVIRGDVAPPPPAYEELTPLEPAPTPAEAGGILNGFFLKFGVIDKGWGDWIGSLGYSFRLHKNISLGLEVMPSYTTVKDDVQELDVKTTHAFTLVTLRAGTSLFFIDPDMDFFKIYAGLGGGMGLRYTDSTVEGNSSTLFKSNPALQILGGLELDTGPVSLIFEYQMLREFDKSIDPNSWFGYVIFGIRL